MYPLASAFVLCGVYKDIQERIKMKTTKHAEATWPVYPESIATSDVLTEAHKIIYGDREQTYGHPSKNLQVIADFWSVHLSTVTGTEIKLTVNDVCSMMVLVKQARLCNNPNHRDSVVDVCGYAALRERCIETKIPETK